MQSTSATKLYEMCKSVICNKKKIKVKKIVNANPLHTNDTKVVKIIK